MPSGALTIKVTDKPGPEVDRANPWPAALRILTRRDYSQAELRQRLLDKGFDQERIDGDPAALP